MIVLGATLAAVATTALALALRPHSSVGRRLDRVAPAVGRPRWSGIPSADLRDAGVSIRPDAVLALKLALGLGAALAAATASLLLPIGPALVALAAYAGFVLPSFVIAQAADRRRREAGRAATVLVERVEALVAAGRPPETALALLMTRPTGSPLLDATLRRASDAYALGAPLFRTLEAHAREGSLTTIATFAEDLERARDLGTGSLPVIRERRASLRAAERAASLEAASQVEGKLMLILVLCYLPALIVLVVIPLFIGLLAGLVA